ncbi:MAG: hypothetical protein IKQ96_03690, partial [Lachnospiraceae bacterium]|nr:hypothetical protein [Lachnospiraceae bacterium]
MRAVLLCLRSSGMINEQSGLVRAGVACTGVALAETTRRGDSGTRARAADRGTPAQTADPGTPAQTVGPGTPARA